jgi:RimJ/RimL family protein N-acetyltransferase
MDFASCKLSTSRLSLTPATEHDAESLFPFVSDPDISEWMSWEAHTSVEQTRNFCRSLVQNHNSQSSLNWVIRFNGEVCGLFGLIAIKRGHRSLIYDKAELAYWCGKPFQGKGIMKEAGFAVLDFAFNQLNLNKLTVGHYCGNEASKGLINSLGFNFHYHEKRAFKKKEKWIDCDFYELFNPNYVG